MPLKRYSLFIILSSAFLFTSCATKEEIERRKLLAKLATEMNSVQKSGGDIYTRVQELEERLGVVYGKVEETRHQTIEEQNLKSRSLEEEINVLKAEVSNLKNENANITQQLKNNEDYLKKVLSKLDQISKKPTKKKSKGKKLGPYDTAMGSYRKGRYKTAKKQLDGLLQGGKYKGDKRARILHNLGMIEFMAARYDNALIYLSKLFTEHPKSGYNKRGLLFLGKSFRKLGKKDEAKQALQELVNKFPKAKQTKEAKKIMKAL